jgi:hypothetical protein
VPAAPHRHELLDAIDSIRFTAARVDLGIDDARTDGVHPDPFLRHLLREAERKGVDSSP